MGMVSAVIVSVGFAVGVNWGAKGVATAYAVTTYLTLIPILMWAFRGTVLKLGDFFEEIMMPCLASLVSVGICYAIQDQFVHWKSFKRFLHI